MNYELQKLTKSLKFITCLNSTECTSWATEKYLFSDGNCSSCSLLNGYFIDRYNCKKCTE